MQNLNLKEYLKELSSNLKLTGGAKKTSPLLNLPSMSLNRHNALYFNWEDWTTSIENIQKDLTTSGYLSKNGNEINQLFGSLGKEKIWIKRGNNKKKINLVNILEAVETPFYNQFVLQSGDYFFSRKKSNPKPEDFKTFDVFAEEFTKELLSYKKLKLFKNDLGRRSFRLRCNLNCKAMFFGMESFNAKIYQITEKGFLIKLPKNKLSNNFIKPKLQLSLPVGVFYHEMNTTFHTLIRQLNRDNFENYCLRLSEDYHFLPNEYEMYESILCNHNIFMFVPFINFRSLGAHKSIDFQMNSFLNKIENHFLDELTQDSQFTINKKSA